MCVTVGDMQPWLRLRADLARPEMPVGEGETAFHLLAPLVIVAIAQLTDPGSAVDVLLLVPAVGGFVLRAAFPRLPAEVFAAVVIPSVVAAVGRDGALEGAFFLGVMMVLYASWTLGSLTRATLITVAGALGPWLVASHLVPEAGIAWYPWTIAHVFTFLLGRALHQQRALIRQLEAARQALAGQAVAEERRRIARELHDLAGHTLAAMVLHVTGARHVLRRDPDEAEVALRDAESVGRSSLDQIRAAVAALRTDERGTDPVLAGSGDIDELVEAYRRAGLDVTADVAADVAGMDGPLGVALHRIAREALANVARHAPGNRVDLRARAADGHVRLRVVDRGSAAARPDPNEIHFGLVGMAERARALGGELDAGPTADGWCVDARLPLVRVGPESLPR